MYFHDLSFYSYFVKKPLADVRNVGWLDANHSYPKGLCSPDICEIVHALLYDKVPGVYAHVNPIRGSHPCNLCKESESLSDAELELVIGSSEIWIPSAEGIFASPSMILHYMSHHNYFPPNEFLAAVMSVRLLDKFNGQDEFEIRNSAATAGEKGAE